MKYITKHFCGQLFYFSQTLYFLWKSHTLQCWWVLFWNAFSLCVYDFWFCSKILVFIMYRWAFVEMPHNMYESRLGGSSIRRLRCHNLSTHPLIGGIHLCMRHDHHHGNYRSKWSDGGTCTLTSHFYCLLMSWWWLLQDKKEEVSIVIIWESSRVSHNSGVDFDLTGRGPHWRIFFFHPYDQLVAFTCV